MNKAPKISFIQLALLAAGSALMFPYTFLPILNTPPASHDAWVVLLVTILYVIVLSLPLLFFANKFRDFHFEEMNEAVMGKIGGKITSMLFVFLALFCFIACTIIVVLYLNIYILPKTPVWAMVLLMYLPITYGAMKGVGVIGRLATFIVPFVIMTIIFFFAMGIELMDINAIKPILSDSTFIEINQGAFLTAARYSEITIIVVFAFYLKKTASVNKAYFTGLIIFGISFFLILMPTLLVLGSDFAKIISNPYFVFTRQVGGSDYMQRVQSFNTIAWFMGTLLKLMIYNVIASHILSGVIKNKPRNLFVVFISILSFIIIMIPFVRRTSTLNWIKQDAVFPWMVFAIIFVIPVIMLIVYMFRKKKMEGIINGRAEELKLQQQQRDQQEEEENKSQIETLNQAT